MLRLVFHTCTPVILDLMSDDLQEGSIGHSMTIFSMAVRKVEVIFQGV